MNGSQDASLLSGASRFNSNVMGWFFIRLLDQGFHIETISNIIDLLLRTFMVDVSSFLSYLFMDVYNVVEGTATHMIAIWGWVQCPQRCCMNALVIHLFPFSSLTKQPSLHMVITRRNVKNALLVDPPSRLQSCQQWCQYVIQDSKHHKKPLHSATGQAQVA